MWYELERKTRSVRVLTSQNQLTAILGRGQNGLLALLSVAEEQSASFLSDCIQLSELTRAGLETAPLSLSHNTEVERAQV